MATKPSASPLSCSRCGTAMKDVVTIAPLAGDPGLIGTSARTVDISRAYWCRRTGVKAAELLRPASQNSRSSRNSF